MAGKTRTGALPVAAATLVVAVILTLVVLWFPTATGIVVIALVSVALMVGWHRWAKDGGAMGGSPSFVYWSGIVIYIVGSVQLGPSIIYGGSISGEQWRIYVIAAVLAALGIILGTSARTLRLNRSIEPGTESSQSERLYPAGLLYFAFAIGAGVIWLNFATGQVPLFSDSINAARKAGVGGALASYSFVGYASLQFSLLASVLVPFRNVRGGLRWAIIILSAGTLVLTGSRSFLILPLLTIVCAFIEARRPALPRLLAASLILVSVVALVGVGRAASSGQGGNASENAERYGYGSGVMGALLSNLQPGPGVFSATMQAIPSRVPFQKGAFFLRDSPYLVSGQKSDYWVTEAILNRDSSVVGGLPPTLLGGLYIDWGFTGTIVGVIVLFGLLAFLRPRARALLQSRMSNLAYGFFAAYVVTTFYSYLSLKINIVIFFAYCIVGAILGRGFSRPKRRARLLGRKAESRGKASRVTI